METRTHLSPHFCRDEFACHCGCGADTVDAELVTVLEDLRDWATTQSELPAVIVSCGIRCAPHNAAVGGAPHSQHLLGKAADVRVVGVGPRKVAEYLEARYPHTYGIGRYSTFTHIDVRSGKARWSK